MAHGITRMEVNIENYIVNLMTITSEKKRIETESDIAEKMTKEKCR